MGSRGTIAHGETRRARLAGPLLAATVLVIGLAVTLRTVGALHDDQRAAAARVMDQRTAVARAAVTAETGRYRDLMQAVAAGLGTNPRLTARDFAAATAPLGTAGLVGATSVAFVVATPSGEIAETERLWRSRGADGLTLQPRGDPDLHLFSIFQRTLNNSAAVASGLDVASAPEGAAALLEARRTGRPTVSDAYVLLRDRTVPLIHRQLSFIFVAPVYTAPAADDDLPRFQGWVAMGLRGQDFLGGVLGAASQGLLDGELYATDGEGQRLKVAAYDAPGRRDLERRATFPVADHQWTLLTGADSHRLPGARNGTPTTVLLGGILLTLMLAVLVWVLATGRSRAREQVLVATAELRSAEAESRRQAGLLGAIMASLGDGVGVVDENGRFLLHNPAGKALLGVAVDAERPDDWQAHYGIFRPDGRTPFPLEQMPLVRALQGEASDGVEMLIRNEQRPDGILISVDGRPLDPSAGQHGAVAVFHDITELRRYENDLAVFAGVVAHDLKAPLAVIRGHCETAADELTDAPPGPEVAEVRAALDRIMNAVDRMAALIDTLLAYTTSRNAPLTLRAVPLGPLVAEVVAQRTEHVRPAAGPPPDVYVGPLPEVRADPAMLRHVLDNLLGNALKYVPPGRAARIDVTAAPAEPGWTRIEVADRGIGIPADDKPAIFESFHRARTAAGYAGTGLGLAICRRIVERHGGTIGVADNPGGGTRFHFTLPLNAAGAETPVADRDERVALDRALAERAAAEAAALPAVAEASRPPAIRPPCVGQPSAGAAAGQAGTASPSGPPVLRPAVAAAAPRRTPGAGPAGTA
ncbi:ATP-binding protein [Couchioplanes caeruleus]|uniref:ATP-binding protein n=1 Tax=Couchioplanes caeruleus TaxID=56438 RepID=UPI0020BD769A|nr:ATP-binding protein [Couchioplanes caeruleus]UQU68037.1 ATP-binding protein [Couchioplanes caeruleus]